MKTILVAIDAKYIHTNLAVRNLKAYVQAHLETRLELAEYTINHRPEFLLRQLCRLAADADVLCFSCYIWNIQLVLELAQDIRKVLPSVKLVFGGPEVSYSQPEELTEADLVIRGEGERPLLELLTLWQTKGLDADLTAVGGIGFWREREWVETPPLPPLSMEEVPFSYTEEDLASGRILYYESAKGCPFQCQYCLSSVQQGMRFLPLDRVYADLDRFLAAKPPQVKFVDRTFNASRQRALAIWQYLSQRDNGVTNFHFEISGDLLDEPLLQFLSTVRKGQFQLEIGVQSTNPQTLEAIQRRTDLSQLQRAVERISQAGNIHQHLDLIAGLPWEGLDSFRSSFNWVYAQRPQQLQLGFLKLLKGSGLRRHAEEYGIVYQSKAPYQVLSTRWLSFSQLSGLKDVEEMVETYYNSGRFSHSLAHCVRLFPHPYAFFQEMAQFWQREGYFACSHRNEQLYAILYRFYTLHFGENQRFLWLLKLDLCLHQRPRQIPKEIAVDLTASYGEAIRRFYQNPENIARYLPAYRLYDSKHIAKLTHLEVFPYQVFSPELEEAVIPVLFDYQERSIEGQAKALSLPLDSFV